MENWQLKSKSKIVKMIEFGKKRIMYRYSKDKLNGFHQFFQCLHFVTLGGFEYVLDCHIIRKMKRDIRIKNKAVCTIIEKN